TREAESVCRQLIPLLARDLTRFAADAYCSVGEEARLLPRCRRFGPFPRFQHFRAHAFISSSCSCGGVSGEGTSVGLGPACRGVSRCISMRPARTLHVNAFASCMLTFGSATMDVRSLAIPPTVSPANPQ